MGYKSTGGSLHQQVYHALRRLEGYGRSRHADKAAGISGQYIYSWDTMKTYMKACNSFVGWVKKQAWIRDEVGHRPRTLEECKPYVAAWIQDQIDRDLSPYTIKMRLSALEKMYQEIFDIDTPKATRAGIKRSRGPAVRDEHFSKSRNETLITVARVCGFRRFELESCKSGDLHQTEDGWAVDIVGKGGKPRTALLIGSPEEVGIAVAWIRQSTGRNRVPQKMDVHSYRAEYAVRAYERYAEPIEALRGRRIDYTSLTGKRAPDGGRIYKSALYACHGDLKGTWYDRRAMILASQLLGHERESVIAGNYLYGLKK